MRPVAVGGKSSRHAEICPTASNYVKHPRSRACPQNLSEDIGDQLFRWKPAPDNNTEGHSRIQVASRNMADGVSHRQDREAKRQGNSCETDAKTRISRGQNRTATSAEHQPECSEEFRNRPCAKIHGLLPQDSHLLKDHAESFQVLPRIVSRRTEINC